MDDLEVIEKKDADTVIICSSELIASVMQEYFNKKMFKIAVEIVDLQSTESGYAFSLLFREKEQKIVEVTTNGQKDDRYEIPLQTVMNQQWPVVVIPEEVKRDSKGKIAKFTKKEEVSVDTDD